MTWLHCKDERGSAAIEAVTGVVLGEIPSMTWHEAMDRYGSDKPDVRFGLDLIEVTSVFGSTTFNAFKAPSIKAIRVPGGATTTVNS